MAYQYINRRGDVYHIQAKQRGDKIAYSASRKPAGRLADSIPEGYEIYERPENAQVFVRRIRATNILPAERQLLELSIRELAKVKHFIVDVEADSLIVFLPDAEPDVSLCILRSTAPMTREAARSAEAFIISRSTYTKMMRFVLADEKARTFDAQRWCFLGSIDDWHYLAGEKTLEELIKKYVPHLGKESFFDLV